MQQCDVMLRPQRGAFGLRIIGGFTLIELIVTVAVLAIVVALAVPSFTSLINSNRLTSQANGLVAEIQTARSEALRRNRTVRLCRSTDGSTCATGTGAWTGWVVMVPGTPAEVLRSGSVGQPVRVSGGATIDFRPDGFARDSTGALLSTSFAVCLPTRQPLQNIRRVQMAGGGRLNIVAEAHTSQGACP